MRSPGLLELTERARHSHNRRGWGVHRRRRVAQRQVIELETMPDHVHLLLEVAPTVPLSALMQKLKGRTCGQLRAEFPQLRRLPAVWSPSWFVSTVGGAPLEVVRGYVENQKLAG